ncbi:MAG: hypothetical protein HY586_02635, partial [Candidatus Omnitrophica bacterium]|nr:hypothetical protein [Candidatus Omnitrophota bacterium]
VRNEGNIICQLGNVELVSGRKATVSFDDQGLIRVVVDEGIASEVLDGLDQPVLDAIYNSGTIQAAGGRIQINARTANQVFNYAVNQEGIVEAAGVMEVGGEVIILGNENIRNTGTLKADGKLSIESEKSLTLGGKIQAADTSLRVAGDWIREGSPSADNLNLEFFDATRSSTVYGDNTFDTLTIKTPGKQMYFEGGKTQTILHNIEIEGKKYELVSLRSTDTGNAQWYLNSQGETSISFVHIGDAHNVSSDPLKVLPSNSYGNNTGFDTDPTWDGSAGDGLWTTAANWDTGIRPGASDTVTFNNTSTSDSTVNAAFGGTINILNVQSNYGGTITLQRTLTATTSTTLSSGTLSLNGNDFTTGTLTVSGGTLTAGADEIITVNSNLNVSSGTVSGANLMTVVGSVDLSGGTFTAPPNMTVYGSWAKTGGTFNSGTGQVDFAGTGLVTLNSGGTDSASDFYNLALGKIGANSVTLTGNDLVVNGTLSVPAGTVTTNDLDITAAAFTVSGGTFEGSAGSLTVNGAVTLSSGLCVAPSGTFSVLGNWSNTGASFNSGGGTVTFVSPGTQTINSGGISSTKDFDNVTVSGSVLQVTSTDLEIDGTLTINSSSTVDLNGQSLALGTLSNNGTLQLEGGEALVSILTMDTNSGTVLYDGTGTYTQLIAGDNYYNLTFNGTGSWTLDALLDVNNNFTITDGTVNANGLNMNVAGNWSNADVFTSGANTVTLDGTAAQTLVTGGTGTGNDFNNLTMNKASGTLTLTTNALDVDGTLSIDGGTFDSNGLAITAGNLAAIGGNFTGSAGSVDVNGTFTLSGGTFNAPSGTFTVSGTWFKDGGSFVSGSNNTVTFDGSGTQTLRSGGTDGASDFSNIIISGGGTVQLSVNALEIGNTLTITSGTLNTNSLGVATVNLTINGGTLTGSSGALSVSNDVAISSGTLTAPSGSFSVGGSWSKTGGTFTSGNNTVTFSALGAETLNAGGTDSGSDFFNLTILAVSSLQLTTNALAVTNTLTMSSGTFNTNGLDVTTADLTISGGTFTGSSGALDVNDNVNLSGGTLTAPSGAFTVADDWVRTGGTFTPGTGTVTFDNSLLTSTISGSTTFYNFTTTTAGKTIEFTAGTTQTVTNGLTLTGSSGNNIVLQSTASGTAWNLTMTGSTQNVSYVSVSDSNASGGNEIQATSNNTDNGRNTNWLFTNPPPAADPAATVLASESGVVIQTTTDTEQQEDFASVVANAQEEIVQLVMEIINDKGSTQSTSVNESVQISIFNPTTGKEMTVSTKVVVSEGVVMVRELDPATGKETGRVIVLTIF